MSNNTNTNEPKKPMQLDVTIPEKFDKLAATTLETTQRLAKRINKLFSAVFVDYHGSIIYCTSGNGNVNPNQQFMVELHFKPLAAGSINPNEDRVRAFKPINEGAVNTGNIVEGLKSIYGNLRTSAKFELTEEAAQILSEFMLPGINNGKNVDMWDPSTYNSVKFEYVDNPQFGQSPIMCKVAALDLIRLIAKMYGRKSETGKRVEYGIIPYGPVTPLNNQMVQNTANWRVLIMQIDAEKTFDLASEFGIIPAGNGGSVVTGF